MATPAMSETVAGKYGPTSGRGKNNESLGSPVYCLVVMNGGSSRALTALVEKRNLANLLDGTNHHWKNGDHWDSLT